MNNFEYLLDKHTIENIKEMIAPKLAVNKFNNEPCNCNDIQCYNCIFDKKRCCSSIKDKIWWLNSERVSIYKEGDIVIAYEGDVLIIKEIDIVNKKALLVNRLIEPRTTYTATLKDIKRKVGSIHE